MIRYQERLFKIYQILHFDNNLSPKGWIYDKDWFKIHVQNIIFNTESKYQIKGIKEISPLDNTDNSYFDPESHEYDSLSQIYNWHSMDIKSYLGGKKKAKKNHIINLLKKNLIKNLNLHDKTYIILPNLKKKVERNSFKNIQFFQSSIHI